MNLVENRNEIHLSFQDPSTTKIVCDLPGREGLKGSNWFKLILKVAVFYEFVNTILPFCIIRWMVKR